MYDLTGKGETIVRGGFGIFYDRPQGNMVFDMIANAPGVLNSTLRGDSCRTSRRPVAIPNPTLGMSPTAFDFKPPRVNQWNVGIQHKVWKEVIVELAYMGSKSYRPPAHRADQLAAVRRTSSRRTRIRRARRATIGIVGPTDGSAAAVSGVTATSRLWDYSGYGNYNGLQTSVSRRFDRGFMFSGFWVWSKALGINDNDGAEGVPT